MGNDAYEEGYKLGRKLGHEIGSPYAPFSDDDVSWRLGVAASFLSIIARRKNVCSELENDCEQDEGA